MYQIKCCLFVVCLCFVEIKAQFRIVGLLNVDQQQINVEHNSSAYQTNAQGRGFSVDENVKRSSAVRPKNIIRVRIIDDLTSKNDFVPNADNIFMVEANKEEIKRSFGYRRLQATKPSKTGRKSLVSVCADTDIFLPFQMSSCIKRNGHIHSES